MDIIQGLIETGSIGGRSGLRIVNVNKTFDVINNQTSNVIFSILNDGSIGSGSNIYTNVITNYVNGSVNTSPVISSQWTTSGVKIYYNQGNIGIGTIDPIVPLHIYNATNARLLLDTTTSGTASLEFRRGVGTDMLNDYRFINDTNSSLKLQYENTSQIFGDATANIALFSSNETIIYKNTAMYGKVGIGTNYHTTRTLDVVGDANISGVISASNLIISSNAIITNSLTSNTSLTIQNSFLRTLPNEIVVPSLIIPNEIVVSPLPTEIVIAGTTSGTIGTTDRYIAFPYSGSAATKDYTFTTSENLICDILVVGGGGSGGQYGGGGGGGDVLYFDSILFNKSVSFNISVGKGGFGNSRDSGTHGGGYNGNNSSIIGGVINIIAGGGGGGGGYYSAALNGTSISYTNPKTGISQISSGGGGGSIRDNTSASGNTVSGDGATNLDSIFAAGGGGGAGGISNGSIGNAPNKPSGILGGNGGIGYESDITGVMVQYGGGGGGGDWTGPETPGVGVYGGGNGGAPPQNGVNGTGGGGGGRNALGSNLEGQGGTGIVIIRYRKVSSELVVSGTIAGTTDRYIQLPYSGTGATKDYTITTTENLICDILIVGGGGGGGASIGSGGGGGGLQYYTGLTITANTYTISVGNGGVGATNYLARGANGVNSTAFSYTAYGGGGGGGQSWVYNQTNTAGGTLQTTSANQGSGAGGTRYKTLGNTGTSGQGNSGGNASSDQMVAGGGGGAGGVGGTAQNTIGGLGGVGIYNSITGSSIGYAGGGAGSGGNEVKYGALATEGGGNSGTSNGTGAFLIGSSGTNGRGGGGGGGVDSGGNGGSGIVIIRYRKVSSEMIVSEIITGTTDRYIQFPYSGIGTTKDYTFTTTESILCDILVVGGGGAGGSRAGSGGGAGALIYQKNIQLSGSYNIKVGRGGIGVVGGGGNIGANGIDSSFGNIILAKGGGGGGGWGGLGASGGSGGGNAGDSSSSTRAIAVSTNIPSGVYGNAGGISTVPSGLYAGAGGGGAGSRGNDGTATLCGNGGDGLSINITGTYRFYAAGGGGSANVSPTAFGLGGSGIGGNGNTVGIGGNGAPNTGSGGGGAGATASVNAFLGGSGGSGIVIIRYKKDIVQSASLELITPLLTPIGNQIYKVVNYNGEFKIISSTSNVDTDYIRITTTGAITNPTGTASWNTGSDRRIKENIARASYDKCYENINRLELNRFNYIKGFNSVNRDKTQLGFIAQEVYDIFPKAISSQEYYDNSLSIPDLLTVDVTQINYSLYGAVKKLIKINKDEETKLETLNRRIKTIEGILNITSEPSTSNIVSDVSTSNIVSDVLTSNIVSDVLTSNIVSDVLTSNILSDVSTSNIVSDVSTSNIETDSSTSNLQV
jgi:hypothetical protein